MNPAEQRIDELLITRTTEGLSEAEARELDELLAKHPEVDAERYDRAAAAITLAALARAAPMPSALRARLEQRTDEIRPD